MNSKLQNQTINRWNSISTKTHFSLKDSKYHETIPKYIFVVSVCIILKLNLDEMTLVLGGECKKCFDCVTCCFTA